MATLRLIAEVYAGGVVVFVALAIWAAVWRDLDRRRIISTSDVLAIATLWPSFCAAYAVNLVVDWRVGRRLWRVAWELYTSRSQVTDTRSAREYAYAMARFANVCGITPFEANLRVVQGLGAYVRALGPQDLSPPLKHRSRWWWIYYFAGQTLP